jgi:hypothetical protein
MFAWRDYLEVHPAADLFPLMAEAELKELAADIKLHGLRTSIVTCDGDDGPVLLDGRNRLDALAMLGVLYETDGHLGLRTWTGVQWAALSGDRIQFQHLAHGDSYRLAIAFNIRRRHLNAQQRGEIVIQLLARQPDISDRQLGKEIGVDGKTIARARSKGEDVRRILHVETRKDTKGRKQPAKKSKATTKPAPEQNDPPEASAERMKQAHGAADSVEERDRKENRELTLSFEELINQIGRAQRMAEALPKLLVLDNLSDDQRRELLAAVHEAAEAWTTLDAAAKQAEKPAPTSDNDLEIPGFLRRTAEAAS